MKIDLWNTVLDAHRALLDQVRESLFPHCELLVGVLVDTMKSGRKLLVMGNGGSAADAQHIATEFVVRLQGDRGPLPAIALTTDTSTLTAAGNDYGFEEIFARQVQALAREGDVVIGISTSGNSENVLRGLKAARALGAVTAALTGGDGGKLRDLADHVIVVPSRSTARIQEMHILIGHLLVGAVEQDLGMVAENHDH
ncbi:MAG TPA: D-sedoheptulose 7-phosphate isomerase [Acidobacteriota bacterium]|nr:D-sedoheptulose 7-phosphate isomerase [Acidobacteriota bacterium]